MAAIRAVFRLLLLLWLLPALVLPAAAQGLQPLPRIDAPVIDQAGVLSVAQRTGLGQRLNDLERRYGSQVLVLTVPTTKPEGIEEYSLRVAEAARVGRKGIDDGVLILLAMNDRRMRIEVGYGLEGALPDAVAARIIRDQMTPRMRSGDVAGALNAAVEAVAARIAGEDLPAPPARATQGKARGTAQGASGQGDYSYDSLIIGALFLSFVLGGILVGLFGRLLGSVITGGLIGSGAWMLTASLFAALLAMVVAGFFTLLISGRRVLSNRGRNRRGPPRGGGGGGWPGGGWPSGGGGGGFSWPSGGGGGWSSGGGGGGGWSGGGGGFGGGGASGSW